MDDLPPLKANQFTLIDILSGRLLIFGLIQRYRVHISSDENDAVSLSCRNDEIVYSKS